jgi:hypothetical protein
MDGILKCRANRLPAGARRARLAVLGCVCVVLLAGCRASPSTSRLAARRPAAPGPVARLPSGGTITGLLGTVDVASQHVDIQAKTGAIYHVHTSNAKITLNGADCPLQSLRPGLPAQVRAIAMDNRTGELEAADLLTWNPAPIPTATSVAALPPAAAAPSPGGQVERPEPPDAARVASRTRDHEEQLWDMRGERGRKEARHGRTRSLSHHKKHPASQDDADNANQDDASDSSQDNGYGHSGEDKAYWKKYGKVWRNEDPALRAYARKLDEED